MHRSALSTFIGAALLTGCGHGTIERRGYDRVEIAEEPPGHPTALRLSGSAFGGGTVVERMDVKRTGRQLRVNIYTLPLPRRGLGAGFDYHVPLPDDVDLVTFGRDDAILWRRSDGVVPP